MQSLSTNLTGEAGPGARIEKQKLTNKQENVRK